MTADLVTACQVCGRPLPELAVLHNNPHCSSTCAREHYGTQLPVVKAPARAGEPASEAYGRRNDTKKVSKDHLVESPADRRYREAWRGIKH